ncbi:MAG: hypothetical protein U0074_23205 [Kouleothrix sp.]
MIALFASLVLCPLLYLPGLFFSYALLGAAQPPDALERHFERVAAGVLLNGWLVLTLAELGIFSAWLHVLLLILFCLACGFIAWRRGGLRLQRARTAAGAIARPRTVRTWVAQHGVTGLFVAVLVLFALLVARPFEVVLGARDAGVYAATGFAIARTGGIVQHDALVQQIAEDQRSPDPLLRAAAEQAETNLLGIQDKERYIATRLRFAGFLINNGELSSGRVVPQFFHLYPAWIGLLASLLGLRGGLLATSMFGLLGVWSVGMLGRRLAGRWVGLLGALFLALNGAQVWFSRYSTSEACAQFLSFAALYFFAAMHLPIEPTSLRPNQQQPFAPGNYRTFAGVLAGVAAGQLAMARIDFFPIVLPLLAYLAYQALMRRWSRPLSALALGLSAMLAHMSIHIVTISRAYVIDTLFARLQDKSAIIATLTLPLLNPTLREIFYGTSRSVLKQTWRLPAEIALLVALIIAFVLLRRDSRPQRWFERQVLRGRHWLLAALALAVLALGLYGYFIRPQILTGRALAALPSCIAQPASAECLVLQGYIGAPIAAAEHPNALAYALSALPQRLRGRPAAVQNATAQADASVREAPANGAELSQVQAGASLQLLGKDSHNRSFLVNDARGLLGWVLTSTLALDQPTIAALPIQRDDIVARVGNPREATSFSFANPGESTKIGIAQANLVRVGWYLSPLGMLLALLGAALWWWRGLNRASWLFLLASLVSTFFFVRLSYGTSDLTYIYILRRYIPLAYPALSLCAAYLIVSIAQWKSTFVSAGATNAAQPPAAQTHTPASRFRARVKLVFAGALVLAQVAFFLLTNRQLYPHVEYAGALDQLAAIAGQFAPGDVLLFRGEGRDTPDLVATPLKYAYGLDTFVVRSTDPGRYAAQLGDYVRRWQAQGRQVYLVLGANGSLQLPGLRAVQVGPAALRLPEFQQLRDQKPSLPQEFSFDFMVYRLEPAAAEPAALIAPDDFIAQLRGFYHPEQINGATVAWTDGDAVLRMPWPQQAATLTLELAPGATRPAALGPARACVSYQPAADFAQPTTPFLHEQCFDLRPGMQRYQYALDLAGTPAPPTGALLLRIASPTWVPAEADAAQHDQRRLGVEFGGVRVP